MAVGDDAVAAGLPILTGAEAANTIDTEINRTRDQIAQRTNAVTPVLKGGTGATTASAARSALGVPATSAVTLRSGVNVITLYWNGSRVNINVDGFEVGTIPYTSDHGSFAFVPTAGGTMTGQLWLPNSTPATASWTAAYINGDGRVSRGASSERYKKDITAAPELGDLFGVELSEFEMREGDGSKVIGYIAERLAEHPDLARFVVRDGEGRPDSIDWFQLLMAQVVQLNARVAALEA